MFELVSYKTYKKKIMRYQIAITLGFILIGAISGFKYYSHLNGPKQMTKDEQYQQATKMGSYVEIEVKRQMLFDLDLTVQPRDGSLIGFFKKDTYHYMVVPIETTLVPILIKDQVYRSIKDDAKTVKLQGQLSQMYENEYYLVAGKLEERGINPEGVTSLGSYQLEVITPLESIYPFLMLLGGIVLFGLFYLPQMYRRLNYLKIDDDKSDNQE